MKQYQTVVIEGQKFYKYAAEDKYPEYISRLRLPDYCPKCHSRGVYLSFNEDGIDILRCANCGYSVIAPIYKSKGV